MNPDIRAAVERLRLAGQGPWYAARCAQLRDRRGEIEAAVSATGVAVRSHDMRSPALSIDVGPLHRKVGTDELQYWLALKLSALCDVAFARSTVRVRNHAAGRSGDPFLLWSQLVPVLEPFAVATATVERLGWRAVATEAAFEHCPGLAFDPRSSFRGSVDTYSALTIDLNGWLDNPAAPPRPWTRIAPGLEPLTAVVRASYDRDSATLRELAATDPAWVALAASQLVSVPGARSVERLEPGPYPARGWTVDFGEVVDGSFRARFCTDIFVSRIAPVWYFTHRFALAHPIADARVAELAGWTQGELGFLPRQTDLLHRLREALLGAPCEELGEWQLASSVPLTVDGYATVPERYASVKDLLFRDPRCVFGPAPAMEEERLHRELGTRAWPASS